MTAKPKRQLPPPRYSDEKHRDRVVKAIRKLDFKAWKEGWDIPIFRMLLASKLNIEISPRAFKKLRDECTLFRKFARPNYPERTKHELSEAEWSRIKRAVLSLKPMLYNRTIDESVAIVRTRCACDEAALSCLTSDARPWEQGPPSKPPRPKPSRRIEVNRHQQQIFVAEEIE